MTHSYSGRHCRAGWAWLGFLFIMASLPISGQSIHDEFTASAEGGDGSPGWDAHSATWETSQGGYWGDEGISVWRAVPYAAAMDFACDVTVLELGKDEWLTAGIGMTADDQNYWAINLLVAPENQGRRHGAELQECVDGFWPAAGAAGSRLEPLPGKGESFAWRTNHMYRMEIQLSSTTINGRIFDGTNEPVQFGYRFTNQVKAVRAGRPMLRVNGLRARFENAVATVTQTAPEPVRVAVNHPAWIPRPGQAVAPGNGFFRTAEVDGRWWLVDPEGKPFFAVGTDHVNYQVHFCEKLGYAPYHRNVESKFGNEEAWAESAIDRLKAWGFNELPAGHSPSLRHRGLPHMLFASLGANFARREWICEPTDWTGFPDVFSPRWPNHCRFTARATVQDSLRDPWCMGTFIDNELQWYGKQGQLVDEIFRRGQETPAKHALWQWLQKHYGDVPEINRQLHEDYANESAFFAATNVPGISPALAEVREGFLALIAERYFSVAAQALREADPDHLVLGCRFAGSVPKPVLSAAGKFDDVFTFNTYPRVDFENVWSSQGLGGQVEQVPRELSEYFAVERKPILITEWSFPALDSGLPCQHGAGMRVDTQEQKAACYRIFANAMADLPFLIGYDYFMWADEPAAGISAAFPEDSNYGLVNEKDEPYQILVQAASEANHATESRHARSAESGDLALQAVNSGVEVTNPSALPAHGWLRISTAAHNRVEEISLSAGQSKRLALPTDDLTCVELQNWDGTRQRTTSGATLGPLAIANASATPLDGIPVIFDRPQPVAAWLREIAPGHTERSPFPTNAWIKADHLDLKTDGVTWSSNFKNGDLFDHIQAGDLALGRLVFALHQQLDGHDLWTECDRGFSLQVQEQPDAWLIEAALGHGETQAENGFRAEVRLAVYKHGGLVLARPLWVENSGNRNWKLVEIYWFCRPAIGGSSEDYVVGGRNVPNYYRAAHFWTDSKLGGCFGAVGQPGGWQVDFWKTTSADFHPDARFQVAQELAPGARWEAQDTPYLWIFAGRDAGYWQKVADLAQQADASVLLGEEPNQGKAF